MKVLLIAACLFVAVNAETVRLLVKGRNGLDQAQDLCTPFSPMRCRMMCPPKSEGITDGCGRCACIAMDKPMCRKFCLGGQRLFPTCQCVKYNNLPGQVESIDPCVEKAETGRCRGYFTKFFYNSVSGQCETFVYGGCGGNSNRFDSLEECKAGCL